MLFLKKRDKLIINQPRSPSLRHLGKLLLQKLAIEVKRRKKSFVLKHVLFQYLPLPQQPIPKDPSVPLMHNDASAYLPTL